MSALCVSASSAMEKSENIKMLNSQLISAIRSDNIKQAQELLKEPDLDINYIDRYGEFPLKEACCAGNLAMIKLLVEKGADINLPNNSYSWTPLIFACNRNFLAGAKFLIENGANVNFQDCWQRTPLTLTTHPTAVLLLLSNGANVNLADEHGSTPLMCAAYNNNVAVVKALLRNGADINLTNTEKQTARAIAQRYNCLHIVAAIDAEALGREYNATVRNRLINYFKTPQLPEFLVLHKRT
jgi:uncharacterized protein